MAGSTPYYSLAYFDFGDKLNAPINAAQEVDRFITIDKQIHVLYSVFGNGVISGWDVTDNGFNSTQGITLSISPGIGIIKNIGVETLTPTILSFLPPNSRLNIYANVTSSSSRDRNVLFSASVGGNTGNSILIGVVVTGSNSIVSIDQSVKSFVSFQSLVEDLVNSHKHRGGLDSPSKIDLQSEVKNQLTNDRIGEINVDKLSEGFIAPKNLPYINHGSLKNSGILTHPQLETAYSSNPSTDLLGEIASVNRMRQTLFMMYDDISVSSNLFNEYDYIPGISSDTNVDSVNSTVEFDLLNNCIVGPGNNEAPSYFFTNNFLFSSPVKNAIITSTKEKSGDISFGLNFTNSIDFENDYQTVSENEVISLNSNSSKNMRLAIKLDNSGALGYPDVAGTGSWELNSNTIDFDFLNSGSDSTFNFRISFYSNNARTLLVHQIDTNTDVEGFSIDGAAFTITGEVVTNGQTVSLTYDPYFVPELDCNTIYYVTLEYDSLLTSGWQIISSDEVFIKYCNPSFENYVYFEFENEDVSTKNFHFRLKIFDDNERTNLISNYYSLTDSTGWLVNDDDPIPLGGYSVNSGGVVDVFYAPDLSVLNTGQIYYLTLEAWDGTSFSYFTSEYNMIVLPKGTSACEEHRGNPIVKNFSIMFELENNELVYLNI